MHNDLVQLFWEEAGIDIMPPNYLSESDEGFMWRFVDDFNPMDSLGPLDDPDAFLAEYLKLKG
jgi:hypothetical protein